MKCSIVTAIGGLVILGAALNAQEASKTRTQDANLKSAVKLLREDVKKGKVAVLTETMELTPDEASKFWPIYNEYDKELTLLGDERLALIREFAAKFGTMSDATITELGRKTLELEARRTDLKKRYFGRFGQAVSPKVAGRFLQIENQLLMIIDLQVASSLPIVE
jgi:hypothetical protein